MADKAISLDGLSHILKRLGAKVAMVEAKADANKNAGSVVQYDDTAVKNRLDKLEAGALTNVQADEALKNRVKALEDAGYATLTYTEDTYLKKVDFQPTTKELEQLIAAQLSRITTLENQLNTLTQNVNTLTGDVKNLNGDVKDLKDKAQDQPKQDNPKQDDPKQDDQPAVKTVKMVSAETMTIPASYYTAPNGTAFSEVLKHVPSTVTVTMADGSTQELPVTWKESSYDPSKEGTQTLIGEIGETETYKNPDGLAANCTITVAAPISALYNYKFTIPTGKYQIYVNDIEPGLVLTDEDFYGDNLDGENPRVKLYMVSTTTGQEVLTEIPYTQTDFPNAPKPNSEMRNGAVQFVSNAGKGGAIMFDMASNWPMTYRLIKLREK